MNDPNRNESSYSEKPNSSDLISRQEALKALRPIMRKSDYFYEIQKAIQDIPSAQPERKMGKWISTDDGWDGEYFVCSVCGCPWTLIEGSPEDNGMNFCPNCGAYMRGGENDG